MEQLLVHELRQRAIIAAAEGNATARCDARYFDASADAIETLSSKLAAARRILSAADKGSPIYIAVQRVLDENSAWIAAPNPEVVKQIALAAGIAWMVAEPVPESLAESRDECERLREALRPFGYEAVFDGYGGAYISPIRRASAALEGE